MGFQSTRHSDQQCRGINYSKNRPGKPAANQATTDYIEIMKKLQHIPSAASESEEDDADAEGGNYLLESGAHSSLVNKLSLSMTPLGAPIPPPLP